jgi:hypothetical protein
MALQKSQSNVVQKRTPACGQTNVQYHKNETSNTTLYKLITRYHTKYYTFVIYTTTHHTQYHDIHIYRNDRYQHEQMRPTVIFVRVVIYHL